MFPYFLVKIAQKNVRPYFLGHQFILSNLRKDHSPLHIVFYINKQEPCVSECPQKN
jgi:hypothetical protein